MMYAQFGDLYLRQELLYLFYQLKQHIGYYEIPQNGIAEFVSSNNTMVLFMRHHFVEYFPPNANKYCADIFETVLAISNGTEGHEEVLQYYYNYLLTLNWREQINEGNLKNVKKLIDPNNTKLFQLIEHSKFNWRNLASNK